MRINPPTTVARREVDEAITGLWSFANALGLLTDDVGERTGGAGVTVDGMLIRDSGVPQAVITAHEAALSILETQIPNGSVFPRLNSTEIITGLWVFAHSSGILVDKILERTADAGVTIDGVLFRNNTLQMFDLAAGATVYIRSGITGDTFFRYTVSADGTLLWGPGDAAQDVSLRRDSLDTLRVDKNLTIGRTLSVVSEMIFSQSTINLAARADDLDIDSKTSVRITLTGDQDITGIAGGGFGGRILYLVNADNLDDFTLKHEDANSSAGNRFDLPGDVDKLVVSNQGVVLMYDGVKSRWSLMS